MNRRAFLSSLIGGVAASAAVRTFPFRVYSFASEIVVVNTPGMAFFAAELEKLAWQPHIPLSALTWTRDILDVENKIIGKAQIKRWPDGGAMASIFGVEE